MRIKNKLLINSKIILLIAFTFLVCSNLTNAQCVDSSVNAKKHFLFSERVNFYDSSSADFNKDGRLDLVGLGYEEGNFNADKVYIAPSSIDGGYDTPIAIPVPPTNSFYFPISIDFDNDGDLDIVRYFTEIQTTTVIVLENDGSMNFTALPELTLDSGEGFRGLADIDGDGTVDLITGINMFPTFESFYRLGSSDGTFGKRADFINASFHVAADYNGDGLVDFPIVNSGNVSIAYNQGEGVFQTQSIGINIGSSNSSGLYAVKDINNDDVPDLIARKFNESISTLTNNGNNDFTLDTYPILPSTSNVPTARIIYFGDFNGDDFLDMAVTTSSKPYYSVLENDGLGGFSRFDYNTRLPGIPFEDINGDNKTDFIFINNLNLQTQFFTGKLFNETQIVLEENNCERTGATKIVDFDADRVSDRTHWNETQGLWKNDLLNLDNGTRDYVNVQWGTTGDIPALGDYDGDGITDYAVYRPTDGVWYIIRSSDSSFQYIRFGLDEDIPVPFDYDGDGKTDIAVYRPSLGNWYLLQSSNQQFLAYHWGSAEDKPVPGDFDGDRKADIAVYRPSTGVWYILKSSNNEFFITQWGISEDAPLPADYDGDGKADLTVFRPSERVWYILRSYNNEFGAFQFGLSDDVPQPGDWNGDGISELGMYRPSQNNWYSSNTNNVAFFGSENDSPFGTLQKIY